MIESFRHKGLKRLYQQDDRSKLPPDMVERIATVLAALDAAATIAAMNRRRLGRAAAMTQHRNERVAKKCWVCASLDPTYEGMIVPMKSPPHPGRGLKDDIDALGLTVAEAAEALGVTRQQLYNVINGKSGVTPEMALRLEKGVGGTADAWLGMQGAYDLAQLRKRAADIRVRKLARRVA